MSTRRNRGGSVAYRTRRGVALAGRVNKLGSLQGVLRLLGDGVRQGKARLFVVEHLVAIQ